MMRRNSSLFFMIYLLGMFNHQAHTTSLDGTSSIVYQNVHNVFHNGDSALGFVRMNKGFTVLAGAVATLDSFVAIPGPIDLRGTGEAAVLSDVYFSSNTTFSQGGKISGQGNTLHMGGNLIVPDGQTLNFTTDTVLDGGGCMLMMGEHAQLTVDAHVTLTLKNIIFKTKKNSLASPAVQLDDNTAKLALDNMVMSLGNDLAFLNGQLFIHNDVVVSGTSAFSYQSTASSFITNCSTWLFDKDTTFAYESSNRYLLVMQNNTATLMLDNASMVAPTGIVLTTGRFCLDNCVNLDTDLINGIKLGDSISGASYDLDVTLLSGARVSVSGLFDYDAVS